jgi:SAM-dependent methyltransferase
VSKRKSVADAYKNDLAYIHDAGFTGFAEAAAGTLINLLRPSRPAGGLVIELGCGSGVLAARLVAAGYDVLGFDISPAMVALARRRVPEARFRAESYLTAELPPCVAVTSVGECFNYLFDGGNTGDALPRLFRRIYDALVPGGLLLFDVAGPGRLTGGGVQRHYREADDWAVLVAVEEDRQRRLLTREITSFRKVGQLYRRDHETHRLRLLPRSEVAQQLREVGFRVRLFWSYGPMRLLRGAAGFLARKPGS